MIIKDIIYIYDKKNKLFSYALNSLHRTPSDVTDKFYMFSESFKKFIYGF